MSIAAIAPRSSGVVVTPTVAIADQTTNCSLWLKLEYCQPSGSIKDRFVWFMLDDAFQRGLISPHTIVAEASSGSTAIALAVACARLGLAFRAFLPEGVAAERLMVLRQLGAEVVLTDPTRGVAGAREACQTFSRERPGVLLPDQFANPLNAEAHRLTTGVELIRQVEGPIHAFVCGAGTGGTLAGIGQALRDAEQPTFLFRAYPRAGGGLDGNPEIRDDVPGIVDGLSELFDDEMPVEPVLVDWPDVVYAARHLGRLGFPAGLSSGLNFAAARQVAATLGAGHTVATVLCDRMERYFSSVMFR